MKIASNKNKTYKQDTKRFNQITEQSVKCKCGHTVLIGISQKRTCSHCGRWVFKTPKDEFEFRMRGLL